ncbi:hypothetical protein KY289_023400 [Solanum tuberosum]|nr:hypothetical protein KY289_023400 [Solanum tuberosum]
MAENGSDVVLDHLKKINCGGDMNRIKIDQIETLEMELRFFRTFINYSDTLVPNGFFMVKMKKKAQLIEVMFYSVHGEIETTTCVNVERLVSQLREFVEEYMDYLDKNLNDALRYLVKSGRVLIKEIEILQKKMRYLRYLYGTVLNGYVNHEKLKDGVDLEKDGDDTFCFEIEPPYVLFLVVLVELEMKKIFLSELKASKFTRSRTFKDKKLLKIFPRHLRSPLRLNEVLEMIGVLVGDILCVVQMLPLGSTIEEDAIKIDLGTIQILEKTKDLKARVETYYKSLKFIPSHEFPTPHVGILVKELSSLTHVFKDAAKVQHEHEILKDFQTCTVSLAYEAEVAIDLILVQSNVLEHSFCSLPGIVKQIKHIYTEVTKMWSENLPVRPYSVVELSKHLPIEYSNLMNDEDIVGFEKAEEKISHFLTRGTNKLAVILIVGMGGTRQNNLCSKVV